MRHSHTRYTLVTHRKTSHRYQVVYRLVGQVVVIVVADRRGNVFSCLNLARALSQLLVMECKTVDVSPERLEKRYPQVRGGRTSSRRSGGRRRRGAGSSSSGSKAASISDRVLQRNSSRHPAVLQYVTTKHI
jgi:hypothetical protein